MHAKILVIYAKENNSSSEKGTLRRAWENSNSMYYFPMITKWKSLIEWKPITQNDEHTHTTKK